MPLVEFTGPPAVGKSSVVAAGVRLGAVDARRSVLRPRRSRPGSAGHVPAAATRLRGPLLRAVADRALRAADDAESEAALTAVATEWAAFLRLTVDGPVPDAAAAAADSHAVLALVERGWMLDALRLRALLEPLRRGSDLLLLDEGLTHPYKARAVVGSDTGAALQRYADRVPLPDVLVVIDDTTDAIVARFRARYRATPTRARWAALGQDPSDAVLVTEVDRTRAVVEVIATAAETRSCRVIRLDAAGLTPEQRAHAVMDRIRTA